MRFLLTLLVIALSSIHSLAIANLQSTTLYSFFERQIVSNKNVQNPFSFSEFGYYGEFESPTGTRYRIDAFFDGQNSAGSNTWRVRIMAKLPGIWRYRIFQSDDAILVEEGNFTVTDTAGFTGNYGHVSVDPENPKYLIHDNGEPHYWIGGKWISARDYGPKSKEGQSNKGYDNRVQLSYGYKSDQQIINYLDQLVKYKHNGILLKIAQYPLENDRISWDLEWIRRGEMIIKEALKRGIYVQVNMFDTWSRSKEHYFKHSMPGDGQLFNVWEDGEDELKKNYLRYIISRFASFANVYWELGNEMGHSPNCGNCFIKLANDKYLPWIRQYDPYQLPIGLSEDIWRATSADIGFLHQANKLPNQSMKRPVIMNELVRYDIKLPFLEKVWRKFFGEKLPRGLWHDDAMNDETLRYVFRRTFWQVFTRGGSGSSEATWLNIENDLSEAASHVMRDHMHLSNLISELFPDLNTMIPRYNLIKLENKSEVISARGNSSYYVVYFDVGYNEKMSESNIDLSFLNSKYTASWLNPSTGKILSNLEITSKNNQKITRPAFKEDIVLLLKKK